VYKYKALYQKLMEESKESFVRLCPRLRRGIGEEKLQRNVIGEGVFVLNCAKEQRLSGV